MLLSTCTYLFNVMNISETLRKSNCHYWKNSYIVVNVTRKIHSFHDIRNLFASSQLTFISDITATTEIKFIPLVTNKSAYTWNRRHFLFKTFLGTFFNYDMFSLVANKSESTFCLLPEAAEFILNEQLEKRLQPLQVWNTNIVKIASNWSLMIELLVTPIRKISWLNFT